MMIRTEDEYGKDVAVDAEEYLVAKAADLVSRVKDLKSELRDVKYDKEKYHTELDDFRGILNGILNGARIELSDNEPPECIIIPAVKRASSPDLYFKISKMIGAKKAVKITHFSEE